MNDADDEQDLDDLITVTVSELKQWLAKDATVLGFDGDLVADYLDEQIAAREEGISES